MPRGWISRLARTLGQKTIWLFYPKPHEDEILPETVGRIFSAWLGTVFLSAALGFGVVTVLLLVLPVHLLATVIKYGPTALGVVKLAEDGGLINAPEWVSVARLVSLPIGWVQDLNALGHLVDAAHWSARQIDWSQAWTLGASVAVSAWTFVRSRFR